VKFGDRVGVKIDPEIDSGVGLPVDDVEPA
jgi:hypothetical protein